MLEALALVALVQIGMFVTSPILARRRARKMRERGVLSPCGCYSAAWMGRDGKRWKMDLNSGRIVAA